MGTEAHCAYCIETLSASLEKRQPLALGEIEALWNKYHTALTTHDALESQLGAELGEVKSSQYNPTAASRHSAPLPNMQSASPTPEVSEASSATSKNSSRSSVSGQAAKATAEEHPLFVTWNTVTKNGEKRLRGCIGTFEAKELNEGLRDYALTSAFDDTRFNPITARELPGLECGVTLLTDFEPASNPLDWSVGTHGLRISFTHSNQRYSATYLPDVAREQGWTKEETLVSLMRKAGWSGRKDDWKKVDLKVVRYQGKKVALGYAEWKEWRAWVDEELSDC